MTARHGDGTHRRSVGSVVSLHQLWHGAGERSVARGCPEVDVHSRSACYTDTMGGHGMVTLVERNTCTQFDCDASQLYLHQPIPKECVCVACQAERLRCRKQAPASGLHKLLGGVTNGAAIIRN